MIRILLALILLLVLGILTAWIASTPQGRVAADTAREAIDAGLGRERVMLVRLEDRLREAEAGWRQQIFAAHRFAVLAEDTRRQAALRNDDPVLLARATHFEACAAESRQRQARLRTHIDDGRKQLGVLRERIDELLIVRDFAQINGLPPQGSVIDAIHQELLRVEAEIRAWSELARVPEDLPTEGAPPVAHADPTSTATEERP